MENDQTKEYTIDDLVVVWNPNICAHSGICAKGLPRVFNPRRKPWILLEQSTKDKIMEQIDKCPSKALSYRKKENN